MMEILIASLAAGLIAQLIKFFIKSNKVKFSWRSLSSYSGMPSSHAAITVALTSSVGLAQGFGSALFAVCSIFTLLIIRDALGLRRYVGQHGEVINDLLKDLKKDNIYLAEKYPRLAEKIGHTPAQILAGGLIGLAVSIVSFLIF